jgi:hypothetical protein
MRLACRPPVFEPQVQHRLTGIYLIYQCSRGCRSSLHWYRVRVLALILFNLLAINQLDKNFIFNSITEKLSIGMVVWRSVL